MIHGVSYGPKRGTTGITSAGTSGILIQTNKLLCSTKFPSGELRNLPSDGIASVGSVGNSRHFLERKKKAGDYRKIGKRSRVRPSAMNPVDHPMGGRTKGGCQPVDSHGRLRNHKRSKRYVNDLVLLPIRTLKFKARKK